MLSRTAALLALATAALATEPSCPVVLDGRVPPTAELSDFDSSNGGSWMPFNPDFVKGDSLLWSDIIVLPPVGGCNGAPTSRFDATSGTIPVEVTLSDDSIFMEQAGFRRAGLQFLADTNEGSPASQGVRTVHFSAQMDAGRPLNLTHEYLLVWHETAAYDANQFNFQAGTVIGQEATGRPDTYKLMDREYKVLWETEMLEGEWQNFGITIDFDADTLQMWYSEGDAPLEEATEPIGNDNSGEGQYQIGLLKKPTGTDDVVNSGFQESGIDEGLIYGGIFIEESDGGCVSV